MSVENFNQKLLVEGKDDEHVIYALCNRFEICHNFDVIDCKGISKLIAQLPVRLKLANIRSVGIIIDADTSISSRWDSVRQILIESGYTIPIDLPKSGLVINQAGLPNIGVWIMPNNITNGLLEDFIKFLVPAEDELLSIAETTLQALEQSNIHKYKPLARPKALIHSWLAWQDDPGTPFGLAITKKYLDPTVSESQMLIDWMVNLFN